MVSSNLKPATASAIDKQVEKVLRGLGNPEPPLDLDAVRELLTLDKQYYSTGADGILREKVSRLKVGMKQVIQKPTLLLTAIRKLDLKALYVPEQRVILLDDSIPEAKHRWNEAHEIGHSILEWHGEMLLGDTQITLSPDCHQQIENEANFAAGRLLFLQERFREECLVTSLSMKNIRTLSKAFGNSITSTLWRVVETLKTPAVGIVGHHPKYRTQEGETALRYFVRSPEFERRFSSVSTESVLEQVRSYCSYSKKGPLGTALLSIRDDRGQEHEFSFETFHNGYDSLTLGIYARPRSLIVQVPASVAR